jgi:hypothetical protein
MPDLDKLIRLDPLLASALDLCVHYLISGCLFHVVRVELFLHMRPMYEDMARMRAFSMGALRF